MKDILACSDEIGYNGSDWRMHMNLKKYYYSYLGIENLQENVHIYSCEQRLKPLNRQYYYSIISTEINGQTIYSVAPHLKDDFEKFYLENNSLDNNTLLTQFNDQHQLKHQLRKTYRMQYKGQPLETNEAVVVTEPLLRQWMIKENEATVKKALERNREVLDLGCRFIIRKNDEFAAQARVSDIDHGGGNIAVYTSPKYRGRGYGKMVVDKCINWCLSKDILPIYLVDHDNENSIKLAKSLGFETFSTEYFLSIEREQL